MKEKIKHIEAFEYYYLLDDKRSLRAVAEKFNVSIQSVVKWKKNFNWDERVVQRNQEMAKELQKKTDRAIINIKANYRKEIETNLKIVLASLQKVLMRDKDGKYYVNLEVYDVDDLNKLISAYEKLVKLDLALLGEKQDNEVIITLKREITNNSEPD